MTKNEFLETVSRLVVAENERRGNPLFSSVVIAQAICESGWGQSQIMMKANAIFGIKVTKNWRGKVYNARTKECYDGYTYTSIYDCFRAYDSLEESIADYFDLITKSERYRKACTANSPEECIQEIKNGGYATSPTYVNIIMSIINGSNLTKYDKGYEEAPDIEKLARDVIDGKFGNGDERKEKLGSLYDDVQKRVNEILKGKTIYVVQKGDTLSAIAKRYHTTYQKIAKDNNIENPDLIFPGQRIVVKNG